MSRFSFGRTITTLTTYDPKQLDGAQQAKEALGRYRGQSCGVKYAEAVRSTTAYPQEIF